MIDWKNCNDAKDDNQYCGKGYDGCSYCDDMDYVLTYEKESRKCEDLSSMNQDVEKHIKDIYIRRSS